jgi:hypothetical protein
MEDSTIKIELTELKREFVFHSPDDLDAWLNAFCSDWDWLSRTPVRNAWPTLNNHLRQIREALGEWRRSPNAPNIVQQTKDRLSGSLQQLYSGPNPIAGNDAACTFLKDIRRTDGEFAASGAFAVLSPCNLQIENNISESFFTGLIRGFLFKNEIEWTATAHTAVLGDLEAKYRERLSDQERRLQELEAANKRLNEAHDSTLKEKATALDEVKTSKSGQLDELYRAKDIDFTNLKTQHEANFKASEDAFHNKLALQKPIDYWKKRNTSHVIMAWCVGVNFFL